MILIIDNYDSFTYNLYQMISCLYDDVRIIKNDEMTVEEVKALKPKGIVLSPGPCTPNEAGICLEVVHQFYEDIPILGICLGHQIIGQAFGASVIKARHLVHGKIDAIRHDYKGLFHGLSQDFIATRYHSLILDDKTVPAELMVTARASSDQYIMGIRHIHYPVEGFQFHPESYKTLVGIDIMKNFVDLVRVGGYYV